MSVWSVHQCLMQGADWLPICYSVSGLNIFLTERLVNENRILVIQPVSFKLQQMKPRLSVAAVISSRPMATGNCSAREKEVKSLLSSTDSKCSFKKLRISEVKGFSNSSLVSQFGYFFNSQNFYPQRMRVVRQLKL